MLKKVCLVLFLVCIAISCLNAQDYTSGRESLFIFGGGGRPLGMGGTYAGFGSDGSAVYYNPAGLGFLQYRELTLFQASLFEGTDFMFASASWPTLNLGTFAVSGMLLKTDNVVFRDRLGILSNEDYRTGQYWFSYALRLFNSLSLGMNFKYLDQTLADYNASSGAFDVGLMTRFGDLLFLGVNAQDILSGELSLGGGGESLPYNIKAGAAIKLKPSQTISLIFAGDIDKTEKVKTKFHAGTELGISDLFFLRGGYDRSEVTFGAGLRYRMIEFDYAYKTHAELDGTHRFGLTFFFGPTIEQQKQERIRKQSEAEERRAEQARRQKITDLTRRADRFYHSESWDSAVTYYNQVLAYDDDNQHAIVRINEISKIVEELEQAEIDTKAGEKAYDQLLEKHRLSADSLFATGEYDNARLEYRKVLELDSNSTHARQRLDDIEAHFEQRFESLVNRGDRQVNGENYADAIVSYTEALEIKPGSPEVRRKIGRAKQQMLLAQNIDQAVELLEGGDTASAQQAFESILEDHPDNKTAADYLRRMSEEKAVPPVAIEEIRQDEEYWQYYLDGLKSFGEGNYEQSIEMWERVLEKYPGSEDTKENLRQARSRLENQNE